MSFNLILQTSIISIGILIIYVYGIVTIKYRVFPFKLLRKIKRFIFRGEKVKPKINNNTRYKTQYYQKKVSFIEEHYRNIDIVMVGDSLIDSAEWGDLFPSKEIANQGIRSDTTTGVLNRIDLVKKCDPSKVFIMVGINDILIGENIENIFKNYQIIVKRLIKNNIKVYIHSLIFVNNNRKDITNNVKTLNYMLEKFSSTNGLITYLDINEKLSINGYLNKEYLIDNVHLNGKGYKVWKNSIEKYVV